MMLKKYLFNDFQSMLWQSLKSIFKVEVILITNQQFQKSFSSIFKVKYSNNVDEKNVD